MPMSKKDFTVSVGTTRLWDAFEAGKDVARKAISDLDEIPSFVLLFSTIHYEKRGGFEEFLKGVWDVLPQGTPLIGGTIAGFMNNDGCYTRGATALAVSYQNMDVAIGIGHNTKRNPKKAANSCSKMIKKTLDKSEYQNRYLIEIVSGGKIPQFAGIGRRRVIKSGLTSKISTMLSSFSLKVLQYGVGREEEILDSLVRNLPDYKIIGGSSMDGNSLIENYQFYGTKIFTNSLVALGVSTKQNIELNTTYGLKETGKKFEITKKSRCGRIIHKIDNMPALYGFLTKISWPLDFIDESLYRKTFFIPLGYNKNGILFPNVIGLFLGKAIQCGFKIESRELSLLSASGKSLIEAVDENFEKHPSNNEFGFIVSCAARLEALGKNIFSVNEKLCGFFKETPFLLIYASGEDTYSKELGKRHINESFNMMTISE